MIAAGYESQSTTFVLTSENATNAAINKGRAQWDVDGKILENAEPNANSEFVIPHVNWYYLCNVHGLPNRRT